MYARLIITWIFSDHRLSSNMDGLQVSCICATKGSLAVLMDFSPNRGLPLISILELSGRFPKGFSRTYHIGNVFPEAVGLNVHYVHRTPFVDRSIYLMNKGSTIGKRDWYARSIWYYTIKYLKCYFFCFPSHNSLVYIFNELHGIQPSHKTILNFKLTSQPWFVMHAILLHVDTYIVLSISRVV